MYDLMDRLYRDGTLEHQFTPDSKEQFIGDIIIELENNYFCEVRSPLEYLVEHTGLDEAKKLFARLERFEKEERQVEQPTPEAKAPTEPSQPLPDEALYLVDNATYLHIQLSEGTLGSSDTLRAYP